MITLFLSKKTVLITDASKPRKMKRKKRFVQSSVHWFIALMHMHFTEMHSSSETWLWPEGSSWPFTKREVGFFVWDHQRQIRGIQRNWGVLAPTITLSFEFVISTHRCEKKKNKNSLWKMFQLLFLGIFFPSAKNCKEKNRCETFAANCPFQCSASTERPERPPVAQVYFIEST